MLCSLTSQTLHVSILSIPRSSHILIFFLLSEVYILKDEIYILYIHIYRHMYICQYIVFCVWLIFVPFIHLCITFHFSNPLYTYYPTIWIYHNLCILFCFIILKNSDMTVIVYFSWCAWVSVSQDLNLWVELLDHSKFIFSIYSIIPNCLLKWL